MTSADLQMLVDNETSKAINERISADSPLVVVPRGGASEVGRSCYHVQSSELDLLVDCGLNQSDGGQFPDFRGIEKEQIDAVILTHAHIDHSGGLPVLEHRNLLAKNAPIITTRPTTALCHTLLHDSIKIHKEEAKRQGREQKFTRDNVHDVLERFVPRSYGKHTLSEDVTHLNNTNNVTYKLGVAGHLLGSAWVGLEIHDRRIVFSGDLGGRSAHLPDIEDPPSADALFLESTYGDRQQHRSLKSARNHLYQETLKAVKNDIPVLIPTFAVGRAQEVMQLFRERFPHESEEVQEQLEVVYDGMARDATAAYHAFSIGEHVNEKINNWRMNSQDNEPFVPDCAWYPEDTSERSPILDGENAPIIVAPSGMLGGGTSPAYLVALVEHYDEARLFFTGYQAEDTPGRTLQDASGTHVEVKLPTTPFPNSEIEPDNDGSVTVTVPTSWIQTVSGFSGYCARQRLYEFVKEVDGDQIKLVHGPPSAQNECRNYLDNNLESDDISRTSMMSPIPIRKDSASGQQQETEADETGRSNESSQQDNMGQSASVENLPTANASDSEQNAEPDSQNTERKLAAQIEEIEKRLQRVESELAATGANWTKDDIRQLIRTEIKTHISEGEPNSSDHEESVSVDALAEINGIGTELIDRLKRNGYQTVTDIESTSVSTLTKMDQVGRSTAEKLITYSEQ